MLAQLSDVSYRYPAGERPALNHVTLSIDDGEFILLSGPSGSGKSTLARCLNGVIPHFHGGFFAGHIQINGLDTRAVSTAELASFVALVSQSPERQSVAERVSGEVAFGPENLGLSSAAIGMRVEEALALLGLTNLRDRPLETLSGGERQLVAIASAMAMRPRLLVLDEPTSQLDNQGSALVLSAIERINLELGITVLLIEHRLDSALAVATRVISLDDTGALTVDGPPGEVIACLPDPPTLVRAALHFGWSPLPLTVREARRMAKPAVVVSTDPMTRNPSVPARSDEPGASILSCERLSYSYERRSIIDQFDASYPAGTITAMLGANGAGKSTVLKLLRGLLRPDSGRVLIDGTTIAKRPIQDLAPLVGYLPQDPNRLLFNSTVENELQFSLRCLRREGDIAGTLASVGLNGFEQRSPLDLSGGESQRLALAAILVGRPRILLLDEPTRGMSRLWKERLGELLKKLAGDGCTVIMVTHDLELAAETADLIQIIGDGRSIVHAPPSDVMAGSLTFSTTINRIFGGTILTLGELGVSGANSDQPNRDSPSANQAASQTPSQPAVVLRPDR